MQVGGLGVFIAKNNMDAISYRYENNRNILTMSKNIRSPMPGAQREARQTE